MTKQRLGPPPVDNLSDVAWARVERNVLSRSTGTITQAAGAREVRSDRRSTWLWLAVPGAAAAAFALAFFSMNGPAATSIEEEPSRIVAGASPSSVSFGDAHLTIEANSAVLLDQKAGKPTAMLEHGSTVFAVAPRGERGPFVMLAGDTVIRTVATKVRVARDGERATVTVESGSVEIRYHGHEVNVAAQHAWSSDHPTLVTPIDQSNRVPRAVQ